MVADTEWADYAARTADGTVLTERFGGDEEETRIWRDPSSAGLLCQKGQGDILPMYRYSDVMADPNTEAASGSARFLQRLVAGGVPLEVAMGITTRLYSRIPHSQEMPAAMSDRILEQWRGRTLNQT